MNQLSSERAAYLAGAIDGEGSISIVRTGQVRGVNASYHARIQIANVKLEWLETLTSWVGGGKVYRLYSQKNNKRACYFLRWSGVSCQALLAQVGPFLLIKRPQADVLAAFFEVSARRKAANVRWQPSSAELVSEQRALHEQMRGLNARGVYATPAAVSLADIVKTCTVDGCDRRHYGRGYCKKHYRRYIEHGGFALYEKACVVCGRMFTARRTDTETCSKPCSDRNQYVKNKEARNTYKREWRARQKTTT